MSIAILDDNQLNSAEPILSEAGFGAMETSRGNLPLAALDLDVEIVGLIARVKLKQRYYNTHTQPLEATYIFPLPDRGAVRGFKMTVNGRVITGEIKERGQARREYDEAIAAGKSASIVEEERPDTFTMRVGNIPPTAFAEVELELVMPLVWRAGEATFRFPLVVAPRYVPGMPLPGGQVGTGISPDTDAAPDASRISPPVLLPGFPNPVSLSIDCSIDGAGLEVQNIASSLHAITSGKSGSKHLIRINPGERVNRDFILRFQTSGADLGSSLTVIPDSDSDKEATFIMTLMPPKSAVDMRRARDVVFVLDRSGSMQGWKMVAARRAVGRMIDSLDAVDRFEVLAFDTVIETFEDTPTLKEATNRARYRNVEWISKVEARGGTEIAPSMETALKLLSDRSRERHVVLVTDGQVGNEDQILKHVKKHNHGARVFTVGIDRAVNAGFLNRLAQETGALSELVESEDRLDEVMDSIHAMIEAPLLRQIKLGFDGATLIPDSLTPREPLTLFAGSPLQVMGRLSLNGEVRARVRAAGRSGELIEEEVGSSSTSDTAFSAVWARAQLRKLEDRDVVEGHSSNRNKIIELSLRHKVLCRHTAFVAVDHSSSVEGKLLQVTQPVEEPDGWDSDGFGGGMALMSAAPQQGAYTQSGVMPPLPGSPLPRHSPASPAMYSKERKAESAAAPRKKSLLGTLTSFFSSDGFSEETEASEISEDAEVNELKILWQTLLNLLDLGSLDETLRSELEDVLEEIEAGTANTLEDLMAHLNAIAQQHGIKTDTEPAAESLEELEALAPVSLDVAFSAVLREIRRKLP